MALSRVWERALPYLSPLALRLYFHCARSKEIWLDLKRVESIAGGDLIKLQVNVNTQLKSFVIWPPSWFSGVENWSFILFSVSSGIRAWLSPPPDAYYISQHAFLHHSFNSIARERHHGKTFLSFAVLQFSWSKSVVWCLALLAFLSHPGWWTAVRRADGREETTEHRLRVPVSPGRGQTVRLEESRESQDLES